MRDSERVKLNVNRNDVQLLTSKATLGDAGTYSCTLKNNLGQDRVTIKVIVVDRPLAPEGPLAITNIGPDGCVLSWKPPKVNFFLNYK